MTQPQPQPAPDLIVGRVNQLTTTFLDAVWMLGAAVGAGWVGWDRVGHGWSVLAGAAVLAVLSMVAQLQRRGPRPAVEPPRAVPGPEDPGNIHVKG